MFPKNDKIKEYTLTSELTIDYAPYLSTHIYLIYDRFLKYSRCGVNHQSINYSNHTKLYTDVQIFLLSKCKEMNGFENVLTSFIRGSINQFFDVKLQRDAQFFLLKYFNVNLHGFETVS